MIYLKKFANGFEKNFILYYNVTFRKKKIKFSIILNIKFYSGVNDEAFSYQV